MKESKKYMNPYLGGVLLGLVLVVAFWVSGTRPGSQRSGKKCSCCWCSNRYP